MRVEAPPPVRLAIVWRSGPHTCEYWKSPNRPGDVRLYHGPNLRSIRVVQSVDEMRSVATSWRTELPQLPTAERRNGRSAGPCPERAGAITIRFPRAPRAVGRSWGDRMVLRQHARLLWSREVDTARQTR